MTVSLSFRFLHMELYNQPALIKYFFATHMVTDSLACLQT